MPPHHTCLYNKNFTRLPSTLHEPSCGAERCEQASRDNGWTGAGLTCQDPAGKSEKGGYCKLVKLFNQEMMLRPGLLALALFLSKLTTGHRCQLSSLLIRDELSRLPLCLCLEQHVCIVTSLATPSVPSHLMRCLQGSKCVNGALNASHYGSAYPPACVECQCSPMTEQQRKLVSQACICCPQAPCRPPPAHDHMGAWSVYLPCPRVQNRWHDR